MKHIWLGLLAASAAWTGAAARTMYSVQPVADVELCSMHYDNCVLIGTALREILAEGGETGRINDAVL